MFIKNKKRILLFIILLSVVIFNNANFTAEITDADNDSLIAKIELDALKNRLQSQIDSYSADVDNKIDNAVSSYIAGIKMAPIGDLINQYSSWNCGTNYVWRNNKCYNSNDVLGGSKTTILVHDIRSSGCNSTITYSNSITNNIFIATKDDSTIYLSAKSYVLTYNEMNMISYAQGATTTGNNMSVLSRASSLINDLKRNGSLATSFTKNYTWPELMHFTCYVTENIGTTTEKGIFSANCVGTEHYVREDGELTSGITVSERNNAKGTVSGSFGVTGNQTFVKNIKPAWEKTKTHNQLKIQEWSQYTGKDELIISGAPVAFVNDESEITVTLNTNVAGTVYLYSSENGIPYINLVNSDKCVIKQFSKAASNEKIVLKLCAGGEVIRAVFIPNTDTGVLDITNVKYKIEE